MESIVLTLICLGVMTCAALAGAALRVRLPDHHTAENSRDAVLRSVGLVVTLSAMVLGFLVSSAKSYYSSVEGELTDIAADVAALDHALSRYGPAAEPAQLLLRRSVGSAVRVVWPGYPSTLPQFEHQRGIEASDRLFDAIDALPAGDPRQSQLRAQAIDYLEDMQHAGLKLARIAQSRPQAPLLAIVVSWLAIIYLGFGLVSARTGTAYAAMGLSAVAAAGALYLVAELFTPVTGLIRVDPSILESAVAPSGQT